MFFNKHIIEIAGQADSETVKIIGRCVKSALDYEDLPFRAKVTVTVTDDKGIQELNREHRNIDRPTDVLSFPMLDWVDGKGPMPEAEDYDPSCKRVLLGDVVISAERARAQAEEFGHSFSRECGYLCVHSILHLLGYDHVDEGPRKMLMRGHEEDIMRFADMRAQIKLFGVKKWK